MFFEPKLYCTCTKCGRKAIVENTAYSSIPVVYRYLCENCGNVGWIREDKISIDSDDETRELYNSIDKQKDIIQDLKKEVAELKEELKEVKVKIKDQEKKMIFL